MRFRALFVAVLLLMTSAVFAKDAWLSIGGSVGSFRTDARIFNPSQSKDIQVQAYYLPIGNVDNSGVQPVTITVPKRSQVVYDDVVASLFHSSGLGAIRLKSDDDFVATQRIYAGVSNSGSSTPCSPSVNPCTLGQFLIAVDTAAAQKAGVLVQLKSNTAFRTNIGLVNPNGVAANVTWRLYDKNNAVVGTVNTSAMPATIQPFGVVGPTNVSAIFTAPGADLSDAWVGYTSDQPVIAYASVVDNGSTDQTYVPALTDSDPPSTTTQPTAKTFDVTLQSFDILFTPAVTGLKVGDLVTLRISARDPLHGFRMQGPSGADLVPDRGLYRVGDTIVKTFTITETGTYFYTCTNSGCGTGHSDMSGIITVGAASPDGNPKY